MKKICLTVVGMYLMLLHAHSQFVVKDTSNYKPKKLKLDEVNFVSSYYNQSADKSAVMGGRTDSKGIGDVTDFATGLDVKFVGWDARQRKNSLTAGLGIDYHTAASQAFVDSNGKARNNGTRIYPTVEWTIENEKKGTEFGIGTYYSSENNYYHSIGLNTSFSKKTHNNGEFSVKLTGYFDQIKMIKPTEFIPIDSIKTGSTRDSIVYVTTASGRTQALSYTTGQVVGKGARVEVPSSARNTLTAEFSFSQVINQRMQGSVVLDLVYQSGYLGLPFHRVYFNNGKDTIENLPSQRFKFPIGFRLNYFAGDNIIIRTYYRFYIDSWGLISHTANIEVPIKITPFFSLSPFYRFYVQSAADYFAPYQVHSPSDQYFTSNYALAAFTSHSFGAGIRIAPPNGVLIKSLSALEIRYGHYMQTTNLTSDIISLNLKFK
ncbi:MAG: DUF3570 domain-containing protein [Bacteroidetes bacterium]|nr:DUF3570 domain-containing protein [Bacteroidota bacterium]